MSRARRNREEMQQQPHHGTGEPARSKKPKVSREPSAERGSTAGSQEEAARTCHPTGEIVRALLPCRCVVQSALLSASFVSSSVVRCNGAYGVCRGKLKKWRRGRYSTSPENARPFVAGGRWIILRRAQASLRESIYSNERSGLSAPSLCETGRVCRCLYPPASFRFYLYTTAALPCVPSTH